MTKYQCPVCGKRACDSTKSLSLAKLSSSNENQADVIIKCQCCKSTLAVNVIRDILWGAFGVTVFHFGPTTLSKLSRKQKKNSSKWLAKVKEILNKLVDIIINKLNKTIRELISFFVNTFVKRFSISYTAKIAPELKKIFT